MSKNHHTLTGCQRIFNFANGRIKQFDLATNRVDGTKHERVNA